MNERIQKLMLEAGYAAPEMAERAHKLAELIVKDCLDVVATRMNLGTVELCRQECKALAAEIKQHFEV